MRWNAKDADEKFNDLPARGIYKKVVVRSGKKTLHSFKLSFLVLRKDDTMLKMFRENEPILPSMEKLSTEEGKIHFDHAGNKIHFISLGCPRNLVDSEVMLGILLKAGYEVAPELDEADYLVINTCGFLEASRKESMDTVEETLSSRKKTAKLIVTGCMVQTHSEDMKSAFLESITCWDPEMWKASSKPLSQLKKAN